MAHDFFHVWGTIHECRICSLKTDNPSRTVAACLTKPATTEPPTWKQTVEDAMIDMANKIDADVAAADFTARRKAKREAGVFEELQWEGIAFHETEELGASDHFARAMSTPLPHDPDIHTRLMPWRGKE